MQIIDTPGHASFVKNMAVGSALADAVVVVLSAVKVGALLFFKIAPSLLHLLLFTDFVLFFVFQGEFEFAWASGKNTQQEILLCISQGIRSFIFVVNS